MKNTQESFQCQRKLINCFIHPLIAKLFTSLTQVNAFLRNGATFAEALSNDPNALTELNNLKHSPLSGIIASQDNYHE